jgi:hypothetical protein
VLLATVSAMTVGAIAPAVADSTPDPRPRNSAEVLRPVAPPAASHAEGDSRSVVDGDGIETARTSRPIAPGVRLSSYDRLESDKWLRVDSLSVDLDGSGVQADYLSTGKVSDRRTVSQLAAGHDAGPGRRTVAAINADFFDIKQTGAPEGVGIKDGMPVQSPAPGVNRAVGIGPGSAGRILNLYFEGTLTLPSGQRPLAAYNAANVPSGGVGAYTPAWGTADRALTVDKATPVAEAVVRDGKVVSVSDTPGSGAVPDDTTVLVGADHVSPGEHAAAREKPWKGAPDWVSVQTRAHVDTLTLDAPSVLGAGHTAKITATVTQGARSVPVAFPLAADWTGSPNVHIGDRDGARHRHTAVFDPSTGTLTALRPGTITLAVTVNGTTQPIRIRIAAAGTTSAA